MGAREAETLGRAGFRDFDADATTLSGGWRKRLSIAEALVQNPDIVLLDEPTNHLDLGGIEWLEKTLAGASFACVVVSHDRYFLENVPTRMAELNRVYPDGILQMPGQLQRVSRTKSAIPRKTHKTSGKARLKIAFASRWNGCAEAPQSLGRPRPKLVSTTQAS